MATEWYNWNTARAVAGDTGWFGNRLSLIYVSAVAMSDSDDDDDDDDDDDEDDDDDDDDDDYDDDDEDHDAARVIAGLSKYDHITPVLRELHWLPVEHSIIFKIHLLPFRCLHNLAPSHLQELLELYRPSRTLCSSIDVFRLKHVPFNLKSYGVRSFTVHAPQLWNSLPIHHCVQLRRCPFLN